MKSATSALLAGSPLALIGEAPVELKNIEIQKWTPEFDGVVIETTELIKTGSAKHLIYHPHSLAVGIGCERSTESEEVRTLIRSTFAKHNLSMHSVAYYASIDMKQDESAIAELVNVVFFTAEELNAQSSKLKNPSDYVKSEIGTPSVAEASALAAAGPDSELIVEKSKSKRATIAA